MRSMPMRRDGKVLRPMTPLYNPRTRRGTVDVGSTPSTPVRLWSIDIASTIGHSIFLFGSILFATDQSAGRLYAYDVSDPTEMTELGFVGGMDAPRGVVASGNFAFVAQFGNGNIRVVNITDPTNMSLVATSPHVGSSPQDVAIQGSYIYTGTDVGSELVVLDISTPTSPTIAASYNHAGTGDSQGRAVYGNVAYVTCLNSDLLLTLNISTPSSPTFQDSVSINEANHVVYDPGVGHCFVQYDATGTAKLRAVNVVDPTNISLAGALTPADGFFGMPTIVGSTLYLGALDGLQRVDITDPSALVQLDTLDGLGVFVHLVNNGEYIFGVGGGRVAAYLL